MSQKQYFKRWQISTQQERDNGLSQQSEFNNVSHQRMTKTRVNNNKNESTKWLTKLTQRTQDKRRESTISVNHVRVKVDRSHRSETKKRKQRSPTSPRVYKRDTKFMKPPNAKNRQTPSKALLPKASKSHQERQDKNTKSRQYAQRVPQQHQKPPKRHQKSPHFTKGAHVQKTGVRFFNRKEDVKLHKPKKKSRPI